MAPPSARPRDKGGTDAAAKEYANSNSTSARFLGGPQKSWMTVQDSDAAQRHASPMLNHGQHSPGSLRERPGNQQNRGAFTRQPSGTVSGLCQSPSDSQSPPNRNSPSRSFGNALQVDHNATFINVETVLPSPAPSDEHRPDGDGGFRYLEFEIGRQASSGHVGERQTSKPATRHREVEVEGSKNRAATMGSAISPPPLNVTSRSLQSSTETPTLNGLNRTLGQGPSRGKRKRLVSGPATETASRISSGAAVLNNGSGNGFVRHPHNLYRPSDEQMGSFLGVIVSRQQRLADQGNEGRGLELGRLSLLQQACTQHDHQYILMHQIYCMYPKLLNPSQQLLAVGFSLEHFRGLEMLTPLLLSNALALANDATDWFATFPLPFPKLFHDFQIYREALKHVKSCLTKLANNWVRFQDSCIKRLYPPFVDELVLSIGVESPVLQSVIFRAIHKDVWFGDQNDSCFPAGEKLFYENQHGVQQRPTSILNAERQAENQNLITKYQRIQASHRDHTTSNIQIPKFPVQNAPMPPPPSSHNQGRMQNIQHANHANSPFNQGSSPIPSHIITKLAQRAVPRTIDRTPPVVPAQPFSQEHQHSPLVVQDLSGALSSSPGTAASPSIGSQALHGRGHGTNRPFGIFLPSVHPLHQYRQLSSDVRSPTGPWSPPMQPGQVHRVQPMHPTRSSPSSQTASPTMLYPPGHMIGSNTFALQPQSAPRPNALARPMYQQPLLPASGHILPCTAQPNPAVTALHQYHARSPVLTAMDQSDLRRSGSKYFRYMKGVTVLDVRLKIGSRQNVEWSLNIDDTMLKLLSGTLRPNTGSLPMRKIQVGSAFSQVRCIDATKSAGAINESDWMVARNIWPPSVTVLFNDEPLDIRKKIHYGRDLPVDLTSLIRKGTNSLSVSIIRGPKEDKTEYAIGVESIRLLDTETAKALTEVLPYDQARQRILQRLQNDDPEIEVMDASITLNLTDPYLSRIWDVPMRSKTCLHDQCFDLDTFLATRSSKRPGQPCDPDQFRCPICDADARPPSLVKDEFFVDLRESLAKMNRLDAKEIIMQQDGSWRIKEEEKTGETGDGLGRLSKASDNGAAAAATRGIDSRRESETIEIDDD